MRVVNIRELKARLSAYLREVNRGELFLVTDRGRVVARLAPPPDDRELAQGVGEDAIARLAAAGCRTPLRVRRTTDYQWGPTRTGLPAADVDRLLDESRQEKV